MKVSSNLLYDASEIDELFDKYERNSWESETDDSRACRELRDVNDLDEFLKTGWYNVHTQNGCPLLSFDDISIVYDDGVLYVAGGNWPEYHDIDPIPSAVVLPTQLRTTATIYWHMIALLNADEESPNSPDKLLYDLTRVCPSVSFECIRNIAELETIQQVGEQLADGTLDVLDFSMAQILLKKPSSRGYTRIRGASGNYKWHRSGSVLIYNREKRETYLFGQDEETYFGVQLPKRASTLDDAFDVLVHPEAKNCDRQGEWFIVPVDKKDVPEITECLASADYLSLPIDDIYSNEHSIDGDARIAKDGTIYSGPGRMNHDQHESVFWSGWVKFVRNTAVRSVSVEGVD